MTDDLRSIVLAAVAKIAPEADLDSLPDDVDIRDELDIDSIDFLNFMVALYDSVGVDVPEADYAQCTTLGGCVAYLAARVVS